MSPLVSFLTVTCLLTLSTLPDVAWAETREEWLERRKLEAAQRKEEKARDREERKQRAAEERAANATARSEQEARMEELKRRREAAPRQARQDAPTSPRPSSEARPASPAPPPLPKIPGQPTDSEMAAVVQARLERDYNQSMRALVHRCNTGAHKDAQEQQYCLGWFQAERWKTGQVEVSKMRETPLTVGQTTVRQCTVEAKTQVYRCFVSAKINGVESLIGKPMPAIETLDVVRRSGGWQEVAGR
jgi:hypothetical protein